MISKLSTQNAASTRSPHSWPPRSPPASPPAPTTSTRPTPLLPSRSATRASRRCAAASPSPRAPSRSARTSSRRASPPSWTRPSVNTGDAGRDGHLKSADFWHADENPTWTFSSTGIRPDGDDYIISGDLTINGVTKGVELETEFTGTAKDPFGNNRAGFEAALEINRKDFGLTWNATLETGGFLVGDKVKITLDVSAIAKG